MTHAELLRRITRDIAQAGSKAAAARSWRVSPQMVSFVISGKRNIGPKLLKALGLRRVSFVVHRYEPATKGKPRKQWLRKRPREGGNPATERSDLQ